MNPTSEHWHVALGEQGTTNYRLFKFDDSVPAVNFFLGMSHSTFKSIDATTRPELEYRMYNALEQTGTMLFDGKEKYMMLIFGCDSNECMISTYN